MPENTDENKFAEINDKIGKILEDAGVKNAVLVFDSNVEGEYILFSRGHIYESARLLGRAVSKFKEQIAHDLKDIL